jgi:hypothetical protein
LFPVIVIRASLPLLLETEEVTIPTTSPTAYPLPGFTIEAAVIAPAEAVIFSVRPDPLPMIF